MIIRSCIPVDMPVCHGRNNASAHFYLKEKDFYFKKIIINDLHQVYLLIKDKFHDYIILKVYNHISIQFLLQEQIDFPVVEINIV